MRQSRTFILLGVATAVVVAAAILTRPKPSTVSQNGGSLFPDLSAKINDTAAVEVSSAGEKFTLERKDKRWVVSAKSGYPAAVNEVRKLLLGMAQLRRLEPKTSNPKLYDKLELGDPSAKGGTSVQYTVEGAGKQPLASLVIGKRRPANGNSSASELFVRVPGDPQTWLVVGNVPVHKTAREWLDKVLLKIKPGRVRRVTVTHSGGEEVRVEKKAPGEADFELQNIPEGRELDSKYMVNSVARTFADLSLDDVQPASGVDFDKSPGVTAVLETFDGLRVTMRTRKDGDKTLARLAASFDPALVAAPAAASGDKTVPGAGKAGTAEAAKSDEAAKGKPAAAGPASASKEKTKEAKPRDVAREAELLNARWKGWVYEVPDYQMDDLSKKMENLTKVEKADAGKGS